MQSKITYQKQLLHNLTIKSLNSNNVLISGYASVYNTPDEHNDLIVKGAFSKIIPQNIKLLWQHDSQKPIGIVNSLLEDDYGLRIDATINNNVVAGKDAIELISQGALDGLSVGFYVKLADYNNLGQRIISKADLVEVSIVTFPANHHAKISYIKNNKSKEKNMDLELITKQINNIDGKIELFNQKLNNLDTIITRPEMPLVEDVRQKSHFNNYLRSGDLGNLVQKSLNSGEGDGNVLIVPSLYHSIINQINAKSPMRQLASIETISTNALDIVIEDGKFSSGWVGEITERPDTLTPKLLQHRIFVHELYAQPKASQALIDDSSMRIETWLTDKLRDSFMYAENDAFINGDGNKKPRGILSKDHKKIEIINVEGGINPAKLLDMINMLGEEYLPNATFMMNRSTLSEIQKLQDNDGRFIWQQSLSDSFKQTIFGIPVVCCSEMEPIKQNSIGIILADFKSAYKIVDREGINIMRDPYTDKPFVKFYAIKRVGGDVVNQKAIKFAKFA